MIRESRSTGLASSPSGASACWRRFKPRIALRSSPCRDENEWFDAPSQIFQARRGLCRVIGRAWDRTWNERPGSESILSRTSSSTTTHGLSPFVYNMTSSVASLANLITPGSANSVPQCMFTQPNPPPPGGGDPITGGGGCGGGGGGGGQPPPPPPPPNPKQLWCDRAGLTLAFAAVAFVILDGLSDGAAAPLNAGLWRGVVKWSTRGAAGAGAGTAIASCFTI